MKRFYVLSLLAALLLVLTPLAALAQDEPELETYTSEDELLTVEYPAGWFVHVPEDIPFPAVAFINTEDGVARFAADADMQSGDQAFILMLLPSDFFGFMGIALEDDDTIADVADMLIEGFMAPDEDMSEEEIAAIEIGEAEEIELSEDLKAGFVPVTDIDSEGGFIVYELSDGVYAIFMITAFPDEFTEDQLELGKQIAASISYEGTADDLMMGMLTAPEEDTTGDETMGEGSTAALDGEALVAERCTVCHTADRIENADKDEAGWTATVDRMIGYGVDLSDAEREAVIAYLSGM